MTNSETAALTEVTCRRCRMSFRAAAPDGSEWAPRGEPRRSTVTFCTEPGCSVPFWHRQHGHNSPAIVGVYPIDVVAHRAAWLADIDAGDPA